MVNAVGIGGLVYKTSEDILFDQLVDFINDKFPSIRLDFSKINRAKDIVEPCMRLRSILEAASERGERIEEQQIYAFFDRIPNYPKEQLGPLLSWIRVGNVETPLEGVLELMGVLDTPEKFAKAKSHLVFIAEVKKPEDYKKCLEEVDLLEAQKTKDSNLDQVLEIWRRTSPEIGMKISRKEHGLAKTCIVFKHKGQTVVTQVYHGSIPNYQHVSSKERRVDQYGMNSKRWMSEGAENNVYFLQTLSGNGEYVRYKRKVATTQEELQFYREFQHDPQFSCAIFWTEGDKFFRVAPLAKNGTLFEFSAKGKAFSQLPPAKQIEIFLQIGKAIEKMHKNHWAHRDIKPNNILINDDFSATFIDFESVIHRNSAYPIDGRISILFAAPEVLLGVSDLEAGQKLDICSFGKTMEYAEATSSHELKSLISAMMDKSAEKRPSIQEVVTQLESILALYPSVVTDGPNLGQGELGNHEAALSSP